MIRPSLVLASLWIPCGFAASPCPAREPVAVERERPEVPAALSPILAGERAPSREDLASLEQHLRAVVRYVSPAVVAIAAGDAGGSGVVVTEDGLVLTAGHVIRDAGDEVAVVFPDGTRRRGRALGSNRTFDTGMVRLEDPGPHPYVEVGASAPLAVGSFCLSVGQPLGFDPRRTPPVRLGRVLRNQPHSLQTDCTIVSGDSGGPLFDLEGRVVGIHSRIGSPLTDNVHVPIDDFVAEWDHLVSGQVWGRLFRRIDDPDAAYLGARPGRGEGARIGFVTPGGPADAAGLAPGDVVLSFGAVRVRDFLDLACELARRSPGDEIPLEVRRGDEIVHVDLVLGRRGESAVAGAPRIRLPSLMRSPEVRGWFAGIANAAGRSVVEIVRSGFDERLSLAAVVQAPDILVGKWSEIEDVPIAELRCRTSDGEEHPVELIDRRDPHDLALLRVPGADLPAIPFADSPPEPGSFAVSPMPGGEPPRVGVVSARERPYGNSRAFMGVTLGERGDGVEIRTVQTGSAAERGGMEAGDVIVGAGDAEIRTVEDLRAFLAEKSPGDRVTFFVRRGAEEMRLDLVLGKRPEAEESGRNRGIMGELSRRRTGFPNAIQHDTVLRPSDCGGVVVGLDGRAFGINIARSSRVESYAVPASVIASWLDTWREHEVERRLALVRERLAALEAEIADLSRRIEHRRSDRDALLELERALLRRDWDRIRDLHEQGPGTDRESAGAPGPGRAGAKGADRDVRPGGRR